MKQGVVDHLINEYGFEKREEYDGKGSFYLQLRTLNGEVNYQVNENALYIWSGMGMGFYDSAYDSDSFKVDEDDDNQCYGYRVVVKCFEHVDTLMQVLL